MPVLPVVVALLAVAGFAVALWKVRIVGLSNSLASQTHVGISAMFDTSLNDDEKERAVRKAGLQLLLGAWKICWRFGIALIATLVPVLLADLLGFASREDTFGVLLRLDFIVVVSVAVIAVVWLAARARPKPTPDAAAGDAGTQDSGNKIIHALAFSGPGTQRIMSGLDDRLFARRISRVAPAPPIFVTSLARGGTTALLNAMHGLPQVATHLYRDMPFVTAPLVWSHMGGHSRKVTRRKRAHGDGLEIDLESPEAFDEVLWMLHWPEKYGDNGIELWHINDARETARADMIRQFRKISLLRQPDSAKNQAAPVRYLSKNNANIARLDLLPTMFPGCDIVVPLRHPAAHAASLMRQHENFTKQHAEDPFVLRYMRDIGHFEFGALHRPILFEGVPPKGLSPSDPDYWLSYWIAAFRKVRAHINDLHIVVQDDLRGAPDGTVHALLDRLGMASDRDFASHFRAEPDLRPADLFSDARLRDAEQIYDDLVNAGVRHTA